MAGGRPGSRQVGTFRLSLGNAAGHGSACLPLGNCGPMQGRPMASMRSNTLLQRSAQYGLPSALYPRIRFKSPAATIRCPHCRLRLRCNRMTGNLPACFLTSARQVKITGLRASALPQSWGRAKSGNRSRLPVHFDAEKKSVARTAV